MNKEFDFDYKTKFEFIESVKAHSEIVFEWQDGEYEICSMNGKTWIIILPNDDIVHFDNIDNLMNHKIGDDKLIDICTNITVIERTL